MKSRTKKLLIGIVFLAAAVGVAWAAGWMSYNAITETDLADDDDFMFRNVSVTPPAVGKNERVPWGKIREQIRPDRPTGVGWYQPVETDDFCLPWKNTTGEQITIQSIYGVLESGTNVIGGFDVCDHNCANCVAVDSDITFDGGEDTDDGSLTSPNIDINHKLRWHTTSVSGTPGWFGVGLIYK